MSDSDLTRSIHELNTNEIMENYTIYFKSNTREKQYEIQLNKNSTIEDAVQKILNMDDSKSTSMRVDDFEVYMANKKGEPKDDFPAFETNQILSQVNFNRFVIVQKPQMTIKDSVPYRSSYIENDDFDFTTVCWCIKLKRKKHNEYSQL